MINDDELIAMIREAATEQLPIAVMTIKEMRQFAEKVALDCIRIMQVPHITKKEIIHVIRNRYEQHPTH